MNRALVVGCLMVLSVAGVRSANALVSVPEPLRQKFYASVDQILNCKECRGEIGELQIIIEDVLFEPDYTVAILDNSSGGPESDSTAVQIAPGKFQVEWNAADVQHTYEADCNFESPADVLAHELVHVFEMKYKTYTNNDGFINMCKLELSAVRFANMFRRCIDVCQRTHYQDLDRSTGCASGNDYLPVPPPLCSCDPNNKIGPVTCADPSKTCCNFQCISSTQQCCGDTACQPGDLCCDGSCVAPSSYEHCGACDADCRIVAPLGGAACLPVDPPVNWECLCVNPPCN